MTPLLLASVLSSLIVGQGSTKAPVAAVTQAPPVEPASPVLKTPTDDFGQSLKAWLEATKLQDKESAAKALAALQRMRAERNLTSVDDVASTLSGRAEVRASEGAKADSVEALIAAVTFAPDSAAELVRRAQAEGLTSEARTALELAWANPLEHGRLLSVLLLGVLVIGALFSTGFSLALLLRYGAVFSHDVAEGLPGPLKSLALFMAVLFLALPLAGFMGWGYLPFWWVTLFFIFESRAEKAVSVVLLIGFGLSSLALPVILHQRVVDAAPAGRAAYVVASGGTSVEGEALIAERIVADPSDMEASLLSASLLRRSGRYDEAAAALQARAGADVRFAHNAAALELSKANFPGAAQGLAKATEASNLAPADKATAFYNLSLLQVNTLAFDQSKESRKKGDALEAPLLARYDRLFSFDRNGSQLQAPPDIVPATPRVLGSLIPVLELTRDNAISRLTVVALALLLFIPAVVKFRGAQSFSKQCPKCGTTFCWLCQTRSTSQDVCSQCHHLFVVKRGIPPAARSAKNQEISRYATIRAALNRFASLIAPGAAHLSAGHFVFGFPVLLVWALSAGMVVTIHYFAPLLVTHGPLGPALQTVFGALAVLAYVLAQAVKPKAPVVAPAPRRVRTGPEA